MALLPVSSAACIGAGIVPGGGDVSAPEKARPQHLPGLVQSLARAVAAGLGADRVALPALVLACRAWPGLAAIEGHEIGRILSGAGWRHCQWRRAGERVRGYQVPDVTGAQERFVQKSDARALNGLNALNRQA